MGKLYPSLFFLFIALPLLIASIPLIFAIEVFQEDANQTLITGLWANGDGSKIIDGNYSTYDNGDDGNSYVYLNYTIPENVVNITWAEKENYGSPEIFNLTIPLDCYEGFSVLQLRIISTDINGNSFYCLNSSDWVVLRNYTETTMPIFEEAIYWDIVEPEPEVVVSQLESNSIYLTMRGAGAGLGKFVQLISEPLFVLLMVLGLVGIIVLIGRALIPNLIKSGSP